MKYKVNVQRDNTYIQEYKVISHHFKENSLVLVFGTLNCGARKEAVIPLHSFLQAWTEDLD